MGLPTQAKERGQSTIKPGSYQTKERGQDTIFFSSCERRARYYSIKECVILLLGRVPRSYQTKE